jgi:hypothetical protein
MDEKVKSKEADPAVKHPEKQLDKGLEDTFPASDPPASTQPGSGRDAKDKSTRAFATEVADFRDRGNALTP